MQQEQQQQQRQPTSGKLEPTHTHRDTAVSQSRGEGGEREMKVVANMANEKFATLRQKGGNAFKI